MVRWDEQGDATATVFTPSLFTSNLRKLPEILLFRHAPGDEQLTVNSRWLPPELRQVMPRVEKLPGTRITVAVYLTALNALLTLRFHKRRGAYGKSAKEQVLAGRWYSENCPFAELRKLYAKEKVAFLPDCKETSGLRGRIISITLNPPPPTLL